MHEPELLSAKDIAREQRRHLRTVRSWIAKGRLGQPIIRVSPGGERRVYFTRSQVDRALARTLELDLRLD